MDDMRREKITPTKAQQWLDANKTNRSLREGIVEQYAADMRAGNWTKCPVPISFYKDGDLADGQHRLYAIIESGTTQEFYVLRDLERKDGLNIDTGLSRSVVDNGRISGLDPHLSNSLVSAARGVAEGNASNSRMSNAAKLAQVNEHREACEWAVTALPRTKGIANSVVYAAIARAWYYEDDKERLEKFCRVLGTGFSDGDADSAAVSMRNYLISNIGVSASTVMWRDTFLKVQHAVKQFMKRQRLTVIRSIKDEVYPLKKKSAKPAKARAAS
jgi:hypothetical protein